ncbi:MAG: hypothetical protein ACNA71_07860 [Kiritimatiellia bacterium]
MRPHLLMLAVAMLAGGHTISGSGVQQTEAAPGTLTTEQVDALVLNRPANGDGTTRFRANAAQLTRLSPEQRQKHISAGTIPFRITADVYSVAANGRGRTRINGDIQFYVLDADGNVVTSGKRSTKQMCPT